MRICGDSMVNRKKGEGENYTVVGILIEAKYEKSTKCAEIKIRWLDSSLYVSNIKPSFEDFIMYDTELENWAKNQQLGLFKNNIIPSPEEITRAIHERRLVLKRFHIRTTECSYWRDKILSINTTLTHQSWEDEFNAVDHAWQKSRQLEKISKTQPINLAFLHVSSRASTDIRESVRNWRARGYDINIDSQFERSYVCKTIEDIIKRRDDIRARCPANTVGVIAIGGERYLPLLENLETLNGYSLFFGSELPLISGVGHAGHDYFWEQAVAIKASSPSTVPEMLVTGFMKPTLSIP